MKKTKITKKNLKSHLEDKIKQIEKDLEHTSPSCCLGCKKRKDALENSLKFYYSQL